MVQWQVEKPASPTFCLSPAPFSMVGICLTIGTGIGLVALPDRTADYWAWTIKAPLSAAFFGAGYIGAAISFAPAALGFLALPNGITAGESYEVDGVWAVTAA
jgi:hypothetical protein